MRDWPIARSRRSHVGACFFKASRILFTNFREATVSSLLTSFLQNDTLKAGFPNLEHLASIALVLPITTATVERSFSYMKLIKTRFRNRLGEDSLD